MPNLVAHRTHQAIDAVGFLDTLRHAPLQREALRRIAPRDPNRLCRRQNPRARNDALLNRLLQLHIGIARAFRTQVAHRREPGHQSRATVVYRTRRTQPQALMRHLIHPRRLAVGMQQHVRVALNQPRHQSHAGKLNHRRAGRIHTRRRASRVDPVTLYAHRPPRVHGFAIEDARGPQQERSLPHQWHHAHRRKRPAPSLFHWMSITWQTL